MLLERRRWRLGRTPTTRLDHAPDEVGWAHATVLMVVLKVAYWLLSGKGLHAYDDPCPPGGCRRTVQRWQRRLARDAVRLQGALRTAVVERSEPQPVERLFPGGLSPPEAIRRRRWKDPEATCILATALAFLVQGAEALRTPTTVLLAEAQARLDGPMVTPRT